MAAVGLVLALFGFLLAFAVWYRADKAAKADAAERARLESSIAEAERKQRTLEAKADEVGARLQELERELAEAVARRDEKAMAAAMWQLELERLDRQWRDVIVPADDDRSGAAAVAGAQLAYAIGHDVERLREEVGVSIRAEGAIDVPMEPDAALCALRVTEEVLAMAAKSADEVDVSLSTTDAPSIVVEVACVGWDEGVVDDWTELAATVSAMAERLDGSVGWEDAEAGDAGSQRTVRIELPARVEEPEAVGEVAEQGDVVGA